MKEDLMSFKFLKITTEQFAVIEGVFKESFEINLQVSIDFKTNVENRLLACFTRFQYLIDNTPFIVLHVKCDFVVEEETWNSFFNQQKKTIQFPKVLLSHLAVLTVGTSRGILHTKTENTIYNRYHLPTINVNDFLKNDLLFSIS